MEQSRKKWIHIAALVVALTLPLAPPLLAGNDVWTGSGSLGGRVSVLAIDPVERNIIYAAVEFVGILKSVDSGKSWASTTSGLICTQPFSMVIDPNDRKTLYAGCQEGLYKSTNSAATWSITSLQNSTVRAVAVHPRDSGILYVGGSGISKSTDGAQTFRPANSGLSNVGIFAIAVDPVEPNVLFSSGGLGSHIHKSSDGGANWTDTQGVFLGGNIVVDPQDHRIVYAGTSKSIDGGETWLHVFNHCQTGAYTHLLGFALAIDPIDHNQLYLAA